MRSFKKLLARVMAGFLFALFVLMLPVATVFVKLYNVYKKGF